MWIFLPYMNLYSKTQKLIKIKLMFQEKVLSSRVNYKERKVLVTMHKLFEHDF